MAFGTRPPHHSAHPLTPSHVHGTSSHHRGDVATGWPAKHTFSTVTLSRANHGPNNSGHAESYGFEPSSQPYVARLANGDKDHERWHHAISHMQTHSGHHGPPKIAPPPPGMAKVPRSAQPGPEGLIHISASSPEMLNKTSVPQPTGAGTENHKDGGGAAVAGGGGHRGEAARMPRLLGVLSAPFMFGRHIKAAVLHLNKYQAQADPDPPEKYVAPVCGNPYCKSGASRAMANPLRFPVYILARGCAIFGKAGAWAVGSRIEGGGHGPALSLQADQGPVPLHAGGISNHGDKHQPCVMADGRKDLVLEDGRNARWSLGVGSALMGLWRRLRDSASQGQG